MNFNLDQFVKFSAFIITSNDGKIDENEKKILFNHPFILNRLDVDVDPLFDEYELAIIEKKY